MAAARFALSAILLTLAVFVCAQPSSRILGGEEAERNAFPYAASLRLDNAHLCGGTIISQQHVLTAAHCVTEKNSVKSIAVNRLSVRVGSTNQFASGKIVEITQVTVHPNYNDYENDIAILTLGEILVWTDRIKKIDYADNRPPVNSKVTTAGWGELQSGLNPAKLQHTTLTVASDEVCAEAFSSMDLSVICLAHNLKQGSCRGDAGNGAVYGGTLVGVSNFVIGACGSRYPDVYANVAHHAKWIDTVLMED